MCGSTVLAGGVFRLVDAKDAGEFGPAQKGQPTVPGRALPWGLAHVLTRGFPASHRSTARHDTDKPQGLSNAHHLIILHHILTQVMLWNGGVEGH